MKRFPSELEGFLSREGRRVLAGKRRSFAGAVARQGIVFAEGLVDATMARQVPALLQKTFGDLMFTLEKKVPPASEASLVNGSERLHKTVRALSTPHDPNGPEAQRGLECGLIPMLRSESYRRFAELLAGRALYGPFTMQALCNREGDYAGPHTDHHPGDRWAQHGYFDFHFTFCTPGVKRQLLVFEQDGHLTGSRDIHTVGGLTAYRLPRWHYTTPLEVTKKGARRWIVMNSFLDAAHSPDTDPHPAMQPPG